MNKFCDQEPKVDVCKITMFLQKNVFKNRIEYMYIKI